MSDSFLSSRLGRMQGPTSEFVRAVTELKRAGMPHWDLAVSNPTAAGLSREWAPIRSALSRAATETYAPASLGCVSAREQIASHLRRVEADEFGFFDAGVNGGFDVSRLMLTASTSDSYSYLFKLLCDAGDAVLVPEPSYPLLEHLLALEGVRVTPYRLNYDGAWHVDWDSVHAGLATRPRAIVTVTPNNPTASCLTSEEFRRFGALGVPLIVDQVFAPFVRRGSGAHALPYREAETLTFVLDGASKRCALPQLKVGWIGVFGPEREVQSAMAALDSIGDTYLGVNGIAEGAIGEVLDATSETRREIRCRLARNVEHLRQLKADGAPFSALHYQGGWNVLLRLPNYRSDDEWARSALEHGIIVQPGWLYDCPEPSTVVSSLLTPERVFREGLARLLELCTD